MNGAVDYLIEAVLSRIADGRDVVLTIVGEVEQSTLETHSAAVPAVRLLDGRSQEEARHLLDRADVFRVPSLTHSQIDDLRAHPRAAAARVARG